MTITLTKEELDFVTAKLAQAPAGLVFDVLKLLEAKLLSAIQAEKADKLQG